MSTIRIDALPSGTSLVLAHLLAAMDSGVTESFTVQQLANIINPLVVAGAPSSLDDLNKLAAAINDDPNYNATILAAIALKLNLSGGTLTGNLDLGSNLLNGAPVGLRLLAVIEDQKATGTDGGTFTSGAWQKRDLNTETHDPDSVISVVSSEFTPTKGKLIKFTAPAFRCNFHKARLYDVTNTAVIAYGQATGSNSTSGDTTFSSGWGTIVPGDTYRLEHRCQTTNATNGFGIGVGFSATEVYSSVELWG